MSEVTEYLEHYGVKGQRWGVRTKKSTYIPPFKKGSKGATRPNVKKMSDAEIRASVERMRLEKQYKDLSKETSHAGKKYVKDLMSKSGNMAITAATSAVVGLAVKSVMSKATGTPDHRALNRLKRL